MDFLCTEGLLESGVVDLVWGYGWRPPTIESMRQAQHGTDQSPSPLRLPPAAVISCFNVYLPRVLAQIAAENPGGQYIIVSRDGDPPLRVSPPPFVHHIFAINVSAPGPRVTPMPTGAYAFVEHKHFDTALQIPRSRANRVLLGYSLDMPGSVYHAGHERITAIEYFRDKPWATVNERMLGWATRSGPIWSSWSWPEYQAFVRAHDYVVVPVGYGVDRMAAWEAIVLGAIPICLRHPELLHFADLPVAFVDGWQDVTPEWCDANLALRERSAEKLALRYWVDRVAEKRAEIGLPPRTEVRA